MTEPRWIALLRARAAELGSIAAVARELEYSRAAISMALAGKYPANVSRLEATVTTAYGRCDCPFLGRELTALECRKFRKRPMPQSHPDCLKHWSSCQSCPVGERMAWAEERARREAC